jgi:hypothetical protein
MGKFRKRHSSSERRSIKDFQWLVAGAVFVVFFVGYFVWGFISNCIFEWPIRWDVGTCWREQVAPAQQKAIETAAPFSPF